MINDPNSTEDKSKNTPSAGSGQVALEAIIAAGVLIAVLVAVADTPLYPIAFGAVGLAALYTLLNYPTSISSLVDWAGKRVHG